MEENLFIQTHLYSCVIGYVQIYFHLRYRQTEEGIKPQEKTCQVIQKLWPYL